MIKAIFFDFDGVLAESVDVKTKAFAKLFESEKAEIVQEIVEYHMNNGGISRYDKFRHIYQNILHCPLSEHHFQMLCDSFSSLVADDVVKAPYVKGAREFLEKYNDKYTFYVITATPQEEIDDIIKKRKIDLFFSIIRGAPIRKTDAVRIILADAHIAAKEAVFIGDALSDYEAAKKNKIRFIARITKGNYTLFADKDILGRITNFSELENLLNSTE